MDQLAAAASRPEASAARAWDGYYINLDRASERRERIERQLQALGLADRYRRFPAVDGQTLKRQSPRGLGEVGIFRSHLDVIERIAVAGRPGHVIEDDVLLSDLTAEAIDSLIQRSILDAFDIVFLETYVGETIAGIRAFHRMYEQATKAGPIVSAGQLQILALNEGYQYGATSYIISPLRARKLVPLLRTHWDHGPELAIDDFFQREARAGHLKIGCVFPFVTTVDLDTSWKSAASRPGHLDRAMLQRLIRYTFFVRRDLAGYAEPVLDRVLERLPPPVSDEAVRFRARIVQYLLALPPELR